MYHHYLRISPNTHRLDNVKLVPRLALRNHHIAVREVFLEERVRDRELLVFCKAGKNRHFGKEVLVGLSVFQHCSDVDRRHLMS